jgi:hypothetical protein
MTRIAMVLAPNVSITDWCLPPLKVDTLIPNNTSPMVAWYPRRRNLNSH